MSISMCDLPGLLSVVALTMIALPVGAAEPPEPMLPEESDQASPVSVGGEVSLHSRYLWRGLPFSSGPVVQPAAWVSLWGCTATVWSNLTLPDPQQDVNLDEVDVGAGCAIDLDPVTSELGGWVFLFPGEDIDPTIELEGRLTVQWGWFRAFTAHVVDVRATPGAYSGWLGVGAQWERGDYALDASARTGWASASFNEANAAVDTAALDYMGAELAVPVDLGGGFTLRPHTGASILLPDLLREAVGETVLVDFGLTVGGEWSL